MSKIVRNILIGVSLVAWFTLLFTQWKLLNDSFTLHSGDELGKVSTTLTSILNPSNDESSNDYILRYTELFAASIQEYPSPSEVSIDSIPFRYSILTAQRDSIIKQVNEEFNQAVKFAIVVEQWGSIDSNNRHINYDMTASSIRHSILGNLQSLQNTVCYGSFSSKKDDIYFFAKVHFEYDDLSNYIIHKLKTQIILSILSVALLTLILAWTIRRIIILQEERQKQIEFLDDIRHTLQTPLTTIKEASANQMQYLADQKIDEARAMTSYVHAQTGRLQQIVDHLGPSTSSSTLPNLSKKSVSLQRLISHCEQDMRIKYVDREFEIAISIQPEDVMLFADPFYLKTAFLNILDNSLQYNGDEELLRIEIRIKDLVNTIQIEFADNGIGVDQSYVNQLGQKYFRPQQHQHISGLGLGLFQVKRIIQSHGGRVQFSSDTTAGFRVEISIPHEGIEETE